jgi:tetratricopeptide (TPR) repeat protein
VTQTGQVLGTAAYISPEQARGEPATAASDRYALACVAFELLTGNRPFSGAHPAAQARAHVEAAVPSASGAGDGLPTAVDDVMRAGMAKDPARRPATAADFLDALEEALERDVAPAGPPTAVTAPVAAPPRPPTATFRAATARRRWPGYAALAALALVAGAAVALVAGGGGPDRGAGTTAKHTTAHATTQAKAKAKPKPSGPAATQTQTQAQTQTPPATSDDPVALNNQGFAFIQQGKPSDAVAPLQRSVGAFRAQQRTGEIDYAYALYNLGNALRLTGHPADAIPYLEERLRISNYKRGVVKKELKAAQAQTR